MASAARSDQSRPSRPKAGDAPTLTNVRALGCALIWTWKSPCLIDGDFRCWWRATRTLFTELINVLALKHGCAARSRNRPCVIDAGVRCPLRSVVNCVFRACNRAALGTTETGTCPVLLNAHRRVQRRRRPGDGNVSLSRPRSRASSVRRRRLVPRERWFSRSSDV